MVVSFCNLDVINVTEFGSGISVRTLGLITESEEGSNINMMANEIPKDPSKSIYIYHHIVTFVNDSEMIN